MKSKAMNYSTIEEILELKDIVFHDLEMIAPIDNNPESDFIDHKYNYDLLKGNITDLFRSLKKIHDNSIGIQLLKSQIRIRKLLDSNLKKSN